ncbi:MAG TPA: hypothetical protein VN872_07725 [Candidatus Acidoferrum sp.]|nr:hypothetical protein [Candidatus Acidoferrum sp.]
MANNKGTRSRKRRKRGGFSEVKGKIVDSVELKPADHGYGVGIMFQDRTYLSFDVEIEPRITIQPELSDWKTGNYRPLKRWRPIHS